MKKLVAVILTLVLALSVAACAAPAAEEPATTEGTERHRGKKKRIGFMI